jgi:hypothetical protein
MSLCPFFHGRVVLLVTSSSSATGSSYFHRMVHEQHKLLDVMWFGTRTTNFHILAVIQVTDSPADLGTDRVRMHQLYQQH